MFGSFNDTVQRALQADGYVPAGFDCLWVGDEFVWEDGILSDNKLKYFKIVDLEAKDASYREDGVFHQNTILHMILVDQDGVLGHKTISTGHTTWIKQCEQNKRELFDVKAEYEAVLESITNA